MVLRKIILNYGGCDLLCTEMCSAKAVPTEKVEFSPYFRFLEEEKTKLICQIVGNDPIQMAEAAKRIEQEGLAGVNLNFGCAVANIYKQQAGAFILENLSLAAKIVSTVKKAVSIPVSVKFRLPKNQDPAYFIQLGRCFAQNGADFLIFHPRRYPDRRNRPPQWKYIAQLKQAVNIPVFGNGNIFSPKLAQKMLAQTGCDGLALGRIAAARPFIFAQIKGQFTPCQETYVQLAKTMLDLLFNYFPPTRALRLFHKWLPYFAANFDFGLELYSLLIKAKTQAEITARLDKIYTLRPLAQPNFTLV